ncbi:MAG: Fic/DOC family protein [Allosphingosinicella sp.]
MIYATFDDPYCYKGTSVLKNVRGFRDQAALDRFEALSFALRSEEPLPAGQLSVRHYFAVHRHLFQDVYRWAGKPRTIRISKGGNPFCYPEHLGSELKRLFSWLRKEKYLRERNPEIFTSQLAHFLAELNANHPFREGNGRAQNAFALILSHQARHPLRMDALDPATFNQAMIASFAGDEAGLATELRGLL